MPPYEQALGDWGKEKLPFNRRKLDFKSPNRHLCLPHPHTLVSMDVALRSIPELQRQDHITESTSNFALALIGGTYIGIGKKGMLHRLGQDQSPHTSGEVC